MIAATLAAPAVSDALPPPTLPLFPLSAVLFPGGTLHLRVFEVRYLDMVRRCHGAGVPFGVVTLSEGQEVRRAGAGPERFHPVGTLAQIEDLQRPQPGLITLRCRGGARFRLRHTTCLPHGLWMAHTDPLPDDPPLRVPPHLEPLARTLGRIWPRLHPEAPPLDAAMLADGAWVANRWCELLPLPPAQRQQLMALDNPLLRLELAGDLLERTGMHTP